MGKSKPFPHPLGILGDYWPLPYYSSGANIMQVVFPFPPLSYCKWNSFPSPMSTKESIHTGTSSNFTEGLVLARTDRTERVGYGGTQLFSSFQKPLSFFSLFSHASRLFLGNYKYFPSRYAGKLALLFSFQTFILRYIKMLAEQRASRWPPWKTKL